VDVAGTWVAATEDASGEPVATADGDASLATASASTGWVSALAAADCVTPGASSDPGQNSMARTLTMAIVNVPNAVTGTRALLSRLIGRAARKTAADGGDGGCGRTATSLRKLARGLDSRAVMSMTSGSRACVTTLPAGASGSGV
jgi:hypothetical protein